MCSFALQVTTLKSEIASLKMASLEHQLNMVYQQLSQQNASIASAYQQLNTCINMLYQILNKGENADSPATSCKDLYDTLDASSGYY